MRGLVTQRQILDQYGVECDSLESAYIEYFTSIGIEPVVVSNFQNANLSNAELLILTGGGSIDSQYFDKPHSDYSQNKRNKVEKNLFEIAIKNNIPILAICRGFQYLNGILGGKVSRLSDLKQERPIRKDHEVQTKKGSIKVNNFHNDGIFKENLAKNLFILALDTPNDIVEGYYSKEFKILGIQWHPERGFEDKNSEQFSTKMILDFIQNKGALNESYYFSGR